MANGPGSDVFSMSCCLAQDASIAFWKLSKFVSWCTEDLDSDEDLSLLPMQTFLPFYLSTDQHGC